MNFSLGRKHKYSQQPPHTDVHQTTLNELSKYDTAYPAEKRGYKVTLNIQTSCLSSYPKYIKTENESTPSFTQIISSFTSIDNGFQHLVPVAPKAALVPRRVSNRIGRIRIAGRRQSGSSASTTAVVAASEADGAACEEEKEE